MNDEERQQFVHNDSALYCVWRHSGESLRQFVRDRRVTLTAIINASLANKRHAGDPVDPVELKRDAKA